MKKNSLVFTAVLAMLYITLSSDIDGAAHHGHGNITGSASGAVGHCQTSSCHGANNPLTIVQLQVLDTTTMMPISVYNPLQTYLVTLTGNDTAVTTNLPGFGFMASAVLGNHAQSGTFFIPSALASQIHTFPCGAQTIVEHSVVLAPTATNSNKFATQFYWTAPAVAAGTDSTIFFALLNAVNGNAGSSGDYPNAAPRVTIYQNPAAAVSATLAAENTFSVYPNPSHGNITVSYHLQSPGNVTLAVHSLNGSMITKIVDNEMQISGDHQYQSLISVPGVYFVHLQAGNTSLTSQLIKL